MNRIKCITGLSVDPSLGCVSLFLSAHNYQYLCIISLLLCSLCPLLLHMRLILWQKFRTHRMNLLTASSERTAVDRHFISRLSLNPFLINSVSQDASVRLILRTIVNPFTSSIPLPLSYTQQCMRDGVVCVCVYDYTVHVAHGAGGLAESAKQDTMCLSRGDRWRRRRREGETRRGTCCV